MVEPNHIHVPTEIMAELFQSCMEAVRSCPMQWASLSQSTFDELMEFSKRNPEAGVHDAIVQMFASEVKP